MKIEVNTAFKETVAYYTFAIKATAQGGTEHFNAVSLNVVCGSSYGLITWGIYPTGFSDTQLVKIGDSDPLVPTQFVLPAQDILPLDCSAGFTQRFLNEADSNVQTLLPAASVIVGGQIVVIPTDINVHQEIKFRIETTTTGGLVSISSI